MEEEIVIKTEEEVNEMVKNKINKDLNIERLNYMIKEENFLQDLLLRYKRVKKLWGKADSIVKISGVMIVILGGVALIITTCLGGVGIITASGMLIAQNILIGGRKFKRFYIYNIKYEMDKTKKKNFVKE